MCVFGEMVQEHDLHVREVFGRMSEAGMTLNERKCEFSKSSIQFLEHMISANGTKASPDAVQGIQDLAKPSGVDDVRSFLGMANQLSKYNTLLEELSGPLRSLLCTTKLSGIEAIYKKRHFKTKNELSKSVKLAAYDPAYKTILQTDASRNGLGAALLQVQPDEHLRLVRAASCSLTKKEKIYAVIELEALGVVWACDKFKNYIVSLTVTIQTDHKPFVSLLNDIELDKLPV